MPVILTDVLVKYGLTDVMLDALPVLYMREDAKTQQANLTLQNDIGETINRDGGQLERLLLLCGTHGDVWYLELIDFNKNVLDLDTCRAEFLPLYAEMLDADLSLFSTERNWREHLRSQSELLRERGTGIGVVNFIKFYVGWLATVVALPPVGFGAAGFGEPGFGEVGGGPSVQYRFVFNPGSGAQGDPLQAEKLAALNAVLPGKYIPIGVSFELVVI